MINGFNSESNIILNLSNTRRHQKELKKNRWLGYDIKIIKECDSELEKLNFAFDNIKQKRENKLNKP